MWNKYNNRTSLLPESSVSEVFFFFTNVSTMNG